MLGAGERPKMSVCDRRSQCHLQTSACLVSMLREIEQSHTRGQQAFSVMGQKSFRPCGSLSQLVCSAVVTQGGTDNTKGGSVSVAGCQQSDLHKQLVGGRGHGCGTVIG